MSRIPVHTVADAPAASTEHLDALTQRVGKTLNIFGAMAHAPVVLDGYVTIEKLLAEGSSHGDDIRQAIHLTVANVNDCTYCQAAYTGAAKKAGWSTEQTKQIRRGHVEGDERTTTLLQVARQIAGNKGYVEDRVWKEAVDAGWTEAELLEAFADVIRTLYTNYFNHLVGIELDLPEPPELA